MGETNFREKKHIVTDREIINRAHMIKVFDDGIYINHMNGLFYSQDGKRHATESELYPLIKYAINTAGEKFARRNKLGLPLFAGHESRQTRRKLVSN